MRTCKRIACILTVGASLVAGSALALDATRVTAPGPTLVLDGTRAPSNSPAPTPFEAFRSGARALRAGETIKGVTSLEYAAEQGHTAAQWKLGRMYAEGEGVPRNELRAFQYFSRIANGHADDSPEAPQSRYVANAFVALGHYYLGGIPNSPVKAHPARSAAGRAVARSRRQQGPVPGAGHARAYAVQGRACAAAGRARPDVSDLGARRGERRGKMDRRALRRRYPTGDR